MYEMSNLIEYYLGTERIECFESEKEIREYFTKKNLTKMFSPPDEIDMKEAKRVRDYCIGKWNDIPTHFVIKISAAQMPSSCKGKYRRIAVLECEFWQNDPKMISTHARGVVRIVETWEKLNVGNTERCEFQRALKEAEKLCDQMNATNDSL